MRITEQALLDNGWTHDRDGFLEKRLRNDSSLLVWYDHVFGRVFLDITIVHKGATITLPHITTMEHLAQLEYLLSPYTVMDTAPLDAAIRARFAEGGER